MLYVIFELFKELNLNCSKRQTIKVAFAKRAMFKKWNGSQIHCMTHTRLWADLGTIMMDGIFDLRSGSTELDLSTLHLIRLLSSQVRS